MREEDQPPERIWLNPEAIAEHFDRVRARYASKSSGSNDESVPDPGDWQQNELTKDIKRR